MPKIQRALRKMSQEPLDDACRLGKAPALPPPVIPDHDLLRCIGRGSYGAVWLARNRMGLYRAVKVVFRKSFTDQRPFEREWSGICKFEPISRSHEGFIDVLQVGLNEEQGYFYYVMELGDDEKSAQNIDPHSYAPRTAKGM
jgi:serine/threonine protein kinase